MNKTTWTIGPNTDGLTDAEREQYVDRMAERYGRERPMRSSPSDALANGGGGGVGEVRHVLPVRADPRSRQQGPVFFLRPGLLPSEQ